MISDLQRHSLDEFMNTTSRGVWHAKLLSLLLITIISAKLFREDLRHESQQRDGRYFEIYTLHCDNGVACPCDVAHRLQYVAYLLGLP